MEKQELFYPTIQVQIGDYSFSKGLSLKICSDKSSPFDWGKVSFVNPYKENISIKAKDEVLVRLGYSDVLQEVFVGSLVTGYDGYDSMNEILFKDRMLLLEKTCLSGTFLNCTPQEVILEGLRLAGVTEYKLSQTQYVPLTISVKNKNMIQILKQVNAVWGIDIKAGFIKGIFYWGEKPEQETVILFEHAKNIISLQRAHMMWELVTVSIPQIQHSQQIQVIHPQVSGIFEVEKVIFATKENGFIRTTIYFKGE